MKIKTYFCLVFFSQTNFVKAIIAYLFAIVQQFHASAPIWTLITSTGIHRAVCIRYS